MDEYKHENWEENFLGLEEWNDNEFYGKGELYREC
jgi:hypothetical protein